MSFKKICKKFLEMILPDEYFRIWSVPGFIQDSLKSLDEWVSEWHITEQHPSLVLCSILSESTACCRGEQLMSSSVSWRGAGCLQLWRCSSFSPAASAALTAPRWSTTSTLFTTSTTEVRFGCLFFLKLSRIGRLKVERTNRGMEESVH